MPIGGLQVRVCLHDRLKRVMQDVGGDDVAGRVVLDVVRSNDVPERMRAKAIAARNELPGVLAVVSPRTNLAARPRFDGWAR